MSDGQQASSNGHELPDDSEASPERQVESEAAYEADVAAGDPPYKGVKIRTLGELWWVMEKRRWSSEPSMPTGYERPTLTGAHLSGTNLTGVRLSVGSLTRTILGGTNLTSAHLSRANLTSADLSASRMNVMTLVTEAIRSLADVIWDNTPLTRIAWENLPRLGDEAVARKRKDKDGTRKDSPTRLDEYQAARSHRQLAVTLRDQGLNEDADRFAYRGQLMQRVVQRRRHRYLRYIGSLLLDLLAGYVYRPGRAVLLYLAVIIWFANFYVWASHGLITFGLPRSQVHTPAWYEALILSVSSFHGRRFLPFPNLGDPVTILAAVEAVFGLFIEVSPLLRGTSASKYGPDHSLCLHGFVGLMPGNHRLVMPHIFSPNGALTRPDMRVAGRGEVNHG